MNWLPEKAESDGARSQQKARGVPGLDPSAGVVGTGPIRGFRNVEGTMYVVSGTKLYKLATTGSTLLGTIAGTGRVGMSHNQIANGSEVSIVNGTQGYIYNTVTGVFAAITDPNYPGSGVVDYIDTYNAHVEPLGRYWYVSGLAQAGVFNALDRYDAEADPDLIVTLIVTHEEVWVMGQRTIEAFYDTGVSTGRFLRIQGVVIEQGCAAKFCAVNLDNSVFWLGNDGIFYRANGYTPMRISTHAIESAIRNLDWTQCFAQVWTDSGHKVIYWTFPDGQTWGFDVASGLWHRRQSYGLNRWRVNALAFWQGRWIAGDYQTGQLYWLDWNRHDEAGQPLVAERVTGYIHKDQNRLSMNSMELVIETGDGAADSTVALRYSDDGGRNWCGWKYRPLGLTGDYQERPTWNRLGQFRNRLLHFRVSSPVKRDLITAVMDVEVES